MNKKIQGVIFNLYKIYRRESFIMKRTFKKVLSVVLTLAMVFTSITVYKTTAKADGEVEVTASVVNNMINAQWSQPDVEFATLAYFINYADDIQLDSAHWAKASNGWCWTQANPTEKRTALDTVSKSNDNSIDVSKGGTYVLTVQYLDAEGNVVASGTSNAVTTQEVVNTDLNLKVERYETGIAYLKWSLIGGAAKYEVYNADTNELIKTSDSSTTDWTNVAIKQGVTYNFVVKAIDANGEEIAITNNETTAYQEPDTTKDPSETTEAGKAPDEHTNADFSNASWTELSTKAGSVDNRYFINSNHTLSQAVWYGIYAPHSKAAYHNERTACILSDDAASFTFQQRDVTSVWINGTEYANPSTALNCQGDCTEVSTEFLNSGINVVTIVMSDGKTNTFGIKVDAPLGVDATASAAQDTIDPATVAEWTQMAGTTANGSKVFKDATATTSTNGGLDGCYAAGASPKWNITDIMNAKAVFGVVRGNTDSVIIDGVEYINAKDARSTKVYIGNDCIYVDAALLDAPEGTTQYHMITLTGGTALTFILKVEGPEAPTEETTTEAPTEKKPVVSVDGKDVTVENGKVTLGDAEYGYFADGKMYKPGTEVEVTEDMAFTSVNTLSVARQNGAGIRYQGTAGIRFQATVASDNMTAVSSDAIKEGMLITAKDIYEAHDSVLDLTSAYTTINVTNSGWYNGTEGTFCASVCNIVESNYIRNFVAKAYVTITYTDGSSTTVYSNVPEARSISYVASAVKNAGYPGIADEFKSVIDSFIK